MPQDTVVAFYHLTVTRLEHALPKLVEKALAGGFKVLLTARDDAAAEQLNQLLWSYDSGSFLPHGTIADGSPERQPVLIATEAVPLNQAEVLIVTDGRIAPPSTAYKKVLDIFDGRESASLEAARSRWLEYKKLDVSLIYNQQTESGGWQKK